MGKQPVIMKAEMYALSPFQQKVMMPGLRKDFPSKISTTIHLCTFPAVTCSRQRTLIDYSAIPKCKLGRASFGNFSTFAADGDGGAETVHENEPPVQGSEPKSEWKSFEFEESELESDDKLWNMYERWINHFKVSRTTEEKLKRFDMFKASAHFVHNTNKNEKSFEVELNIVADMSDEEVISCASNEVLAAIPLRDWPQFLEGGDKGSWDEKRKSERASFGNFSTFAADGDGGAETVHDNEPPVQGSEPKSEWKSFEFEESELESDEKLWNMYERWINHVKVSRTTEEKLKRFDTFKAEAHFVHDTNKNEKSFEVGLGIFADTSHEEYIRLISNEVIAAIPLRHHLMSVEGGPCDEKN